MGDSGRSMGLTTTCSVGVVGEVRMTSDQLGDMDADPAVAFPGIVMMASGNTHKTLASVRRCNLTIRMD